MFSSTISRLLHSGQPIGSGVTDGRFSSVPVIAKTNCINAPYCVANELVCGEIGRFLGLPVPLGGVCYSASSNHQLCYVSLNFNLNGSTLPPVNVTDCAKQLPKESTGVLLFDILIGNADRHGHNFSVDFLAKPPSMTIFDHGHALFGKDAGKGIDRLEKLRDRLAISGGSRTRGNRHCLLDQIDTDAYFGFWFERIRLLPDYLLEDVCRELPKLGCTKEEAAAAVDFLKYRSLHLEQIVMTNRSDFFRIKNWRLFQ
jgi:hypothetical protein